MCELCSEDEAEQAAAKEGMRVTADRLEMLALGYRKMASGEIDPHGVTAVNVGEIARGLVRQLVIEWV